MKLMFYIDSFYRGGAQRVMSEIVTFFAAQEGIEVIAVNNYPPTENLKSYSIPNNVERLYLTDRNAGNAIIRNVLMMLRLRMLVKKKRPDVVVSFMGRANYRLLLATIGVKVGKIVSVRNDPNKEYGATSLKRFIANQLFKLSDKVVFQTEEASMYFCKSVRDKSTIILNPIGDKFYNVERVDNKQNIICVGRLERQKNHKLLIDAFGNISDTNPHIILEIYGEGELKKDIENYIVAKGLTDRAFLRGSIDDIENVLSSAMLFVLSSDFEGLPNALMEAMAVGVPIVSTDCPCGGPRELTKGGTIGLLSECGDVKSMVDAINSILSMNHEDIDAMSKKEKDRAEDFKSSIIMEKWEETIGSIICKETKK